MDPSEWMTVFRSAHERAKRGELKPEEHDKYLSMREELARSLVAAQRLNVPEGSPARKYFRVAQAFALELDNVNRTLTKDISRSGFSAMVPSIFKEGQLVSFKLTLGREQEPLSGRANIVSAPKVGAMVRASFCVDTLSDPDAERLETVLFDAVLARFK
jgi:hypothetical protein